MPLDVTVHTDARAMDDLAPEWHALAHRDPAATIFQLPEYARVWWAEFGEKRQPRIVELRRDGALAGLAALSLDPDGVLRLLGDLETTDYLAPVAEPSDRDEVADAVVRAALSLDEWTTFQLHDVAHDSGWPEALARAAKGAGLLMDERVQESCPRITLTGSYDDYLASISGKQRHEIRRKARRLTERAGEWTVRLTDAESIEEDLFRFFEMHRSSSGPKGKFLHEGMASFFSALARSTLEQGWLRLHVLEVEGKAVAGIMSFAWNGVWFVYNSAYDHAYRELAPGMVLVAETIRAAAEEGCRVYDFLRGTEEYKYRFGARDAPLIQLIFDRA